jgi:hypothetical protein
MIKTPQRDRVQMDAITQRIQSHRTKKTARIKVAIIVLVVGNKTSKKLY